MSPFLHTARLDALQQLREEGLADERDASAGGRSACLGWASASSVSGRAALWVQRAHVRAVALEHFTVGFLAFLCVL